MFKIAALASAVAARNGFGMIMAGEFDDGFDGLPEYHEELDGSMAECDFAQVDLWMEMYKNIHDAAEGIYDYQSCIDIAKVTVPYLDLNKDKVVDSCEATLYTIATAPEKDIPVKGFDWYDVIMWCKEKYSE